MLPSKGFRLANTMLAMMSICWMIATLLMVLLICRPLNMWWDSEADGHCGDLFAGYAALGIIDVITSVALAALPIIHGKDLQLSSFAISSRVFIFGLAAATIAVGWARTVDLIKLDLGYTSNGSVDSLVLPLIEVALAIMVSSSIFLKPVADYIKQFCHRARHPTDESLGKAGQGL